MARRKAVLVALAVLGAAVVLAPSAAAAVDPTVHQGDVTTCEGAGLTGTILAHGEAPEGTAAPDYTDPTTGATVDVLGLGKNITVTIQDGWFATGVVVGGGGAYNLYEHLVVPPLESVLIALPAPLQSTGLPKVSRYFVCGGPVQTPDPTVHQGDPTTCAAAGLAGALQVISTPQPPGQALLDAGAPGVTVDVLQEAGALTGRQLTVTIRPGFTMTGIVVSGGGAYHLYTGPFPGAAVLRPLTAPPQGQDAPLIERYLVCGDANPTPDLPATGNTPSSATMIWIVSAGAALVAAGVTILLVARRRRATR